jgi:hypothetical protein
MLNLFNILKIGKLLTSSTVTLGAFGVHLQPEKSV